MREFKFKMTLDNVKAGEIHLNVDTMISFWEEMAAVFAKENKERGAVSTIMNHIRKRKDVDKCFPVKAYHFILECLKHTQFETPKLREDLERIAAWSGDWIERNKEHLFQVAPGPGASPKG
jgi:hypothetical protein